MLIAKRNIMNKEEITARARRNIRNAKNHDLIDLFWTMEKSI